MARALVLKNQSLRAELVFGKEVGFPGGSDGKESVCDVGDLGLIPGSGRSPGRRNGNRVQYSCLENATDRGACWATVQRVTVSQTQLSTHAHMHALLHKRHDSTLETER